ncbi:MAG: hypothetical protein AB1640_25370, partial [bacterium]
MRREEQTQGEFSGYAHAAGVEIGAVSVKWVRRGQDGGTSAVVARHEGDPGNKLKEILERADDGSPLRIVVTGQAARSLFDLPYRSETECMEKALSFHGLEPDVLLSLGGEAFTVYPMKDGRIVNAISTSKCAAGTG